MTSFSIFAALLLLAALFLVIRPLVRNPENNMVERQQINLDIYKQRLTELDSDLENGLIEQHEYTAAQQDLEKQLIVDIPEQASERNTNNQRSQASMISMVIAIPAMAIGLYLYLGNPEAINTDVTQTQAANPHEGTVKSDKPTPSVAEMIAKIKQRLEQNPNDPKGWNLLARSYMHTQDFVGAQQAMEKLTELVTDDPSIWANYADVTAVNQKGNLDGKPYEFTKRALSLQPKHPKALWLAGTYHFQKKSYGKAVRFWEILKAQLPPDSKDVEMINASIADAQKRQGIEPTSSQASSAPVTAPQTQAPTQSAGISISGQVNLSSKLKDKASPNDTVFVYARATKGPRMPLAIVRKQVKDLPFEFKLDDSMAMMPQMKLSAFPKVVVSARISKSGNAITQSGDLISNQPEIDLPTNSTIELTIENVAP